MSSEIVQSEQSIYLIQCFVLIGCFSKYKYKLVLKSFMTEKLYQILKTWKCVWLYQTATYHEQKKPTRTTDPRVLLCKQNLVWKRLDVVQDHKIVNYTVKIYLKEYYTSPMLTMHNIYMHACISVCIFVCSCCTWCLNWINKISESFWNLRQWHHCFKQS